jgi:hypothetical protein
MPTNKVGSALLAGALSVILVWAIKQFAHQDIPAEVGSAFTTILGFVTAYLVPDTAKT